jgi:hypothetical protein
MLMQPWNPGPIKTGAPYMRHPELARDAQRHGAERSGQHGLDDQYGMTAADHADVGHQLDTRFGITTRSRASSRAWVGSTIGSWVRGSKACLDCPAARFRRSDRVGDVLRTDDPLAGRASLLLADLADRPWVQLPDGTDPIRRDYWNGATSVGERPAGPVVRTVNECLQAVLWNGTVGIAPLTHALPDGLTWAAWTTCPRAPRRRPGDRAGEPVDHSFTQITVDTYRSART